MKKKELIIISGPDRVGKSTFIMELSKKVAQEGKNVVVEHYSEPPTYMNDIFERYRVSISQLMADKELDVLIWDRSYVCAYILERFRNNAHSYISDVVALETWLALKEDLFVEHIGLTMPWHSIANLHLKELQNTGKYPTEWSLANQMMSRCNEHRFYSDEMSDFFQNITMFPSVILSNREEVLSYGK